MDVKNDHDLPNTRSNDHAENLTKVSHHPGWNDPPILSFDVSGPVKFIKKGLLNKRVAFPLGATSPATPSTSTFSATPPKKVSSSLLPGFSLPGDSPETPFSTPPCSLPNDDSPCKYLVSGTLSGSSIADRGTAHSEISLEKIMSIFENVNKELLLAPGNLERDDTEIKKRLEVLKKMWSDGKLNEDVKIKMMQLAEALKSGQGSVANDLHIQLIVDHTSQVSAWMPGIRKLVRLMMRGKPVEDTCDAISSGDIPSSKLVDTLDILAP